MMTQVRMDMLQNLYNISRLMGSYDNSTNIYNVTDNEVTRFPWDNETTAMVTTAHPKLTSPAPATWVNCLLGTIQLCVAIMALIGNSLVLIAITKTRSLQRLNNYLLVSLAISDLSVALVCMPIHAIELFSGKWNLPHALCIFYQVKDQSFAFVSILNLTAISLERYYIINKPMHYHRHVTGKKMVGLIVVLWVVGITYGAIQTVWFFTDKNIKLNKKYPHICSYNPPLSYAIVDFVITFCLPLAVMFFAYARIFCVVKKQLEKMKSNMPGSCDNDLSSNWDSSNVNESQPPSRSNSISFSDTEAIYQSYRHNKTWHSRRRSHTLENADRPKGLTHYFDYDKPLEKIEASPVAEIDKPRLTSRVDSCNDVPNNKELRKDNLQIPEITVNEHKSQASFRTNEDHDWLKEVSDGESIDTMKLNIPHRLSRQSSLQIHSPTNENPILQVIPDETKQNHSNTSDGNNFFKEFMSNVKIPMIKRTTSGSQNLPIKRTSSIQKVEEWLDKENFKNVESDNNQTLKKAEKNEKADSLTPVVQITINNDKESKSENDMTDENADDKKDVIVSNTNVSQNNIDATNQSIASDHAADTYEIPRKKRRWIVTRIHPGDDIEDVSTDQQSTTHHSTKKVNNTFNPSTKTHRNTPSSSSYNKNIPQVQTVLQSERTTIASNDTAETWVSEPPVGSITQQSNATTDKSQRHLAVHSEYPLPHRGSNRRLSSVWTLTSTTGADLAKYILRRHKRLKQHLRENKAVKMTAYVIGAFIICWMPYEVCFLVRRVCWSCVSEIGWNIVTILSFVSSAVNPFIYNFYSEEFRQATKNAIYCKKQRVSP